MYYIVGDIHGYCAKLISLMKKVKDRITREDTIIFLGDYIDRGKASFETVEFLISLQSMFNTVFLLGNHEDMLLDFLRGYDNSGLYLMNGGDATIRNYQEKIGSFKIPIRHREFFENLKPYYEADDFIAVHAGLNPKVGQLEAQEKRDLLWIREEFYRADKKWGKTVIFGHTPTNFLTRNGGVYFDESRNIIGIDSGVIYGNSISCLRWPDKMIFKS